MYLGTVSRKVDGFFIVSENFNCLLPFTQFKIQQPILVSTVQASRLTGCLTFNREDNIFKVFLGKFNGHSASLIFTSENAYVSFSYLISVIITGINASIERLKQTETHHAWISKTQPKFQQSQKNGQFIVYPDDLISFGNNLLVHCHEKLSNQLNGYKNSYLLIGDTGYSCSASEFCKQIGTQFSFTNCLEVVIHFAYDIYVDNQCVFWSYESLKKNVPYKFTSAYFPAAITGCGNLYFFNENISGETNVGLLKFYSEVFKHVHNTTIKPFSSSEIGNFLLKNFFNRSAVINKTLERFQQQLELITRLCENFEGGYARIESTVSHRPINQIPSHQILQELENLGQRLAQAYIQDNNLFFASKEDVCEHFKKYVVSSTQLLTETLNLFERRDFACFNKIKSVYAAEAILCFFVYGSSQSIHSSKKHNNRLCEDLGLTKKKFISQQFFHREICLDTISVVQNKIHYLPRSNVSLNLLCENSNLCELLNFIQKFSDVNYYKVPDFHWFFLNFSVKLLTTKSSWYENPICLKDSILHKQSLIRKNIKYFTSSEFVETLFETKALETVVYPQWNVIFNGNGWNKSEFKKQCVLKVDSLTNNFSSSARLLVGSTDAWQIFPVLSTPIADNNLIKQQVAIFTDLYKNLYKTRATKDFPSCFEKFIRSYAVSCETFQDLKHWINVVHQQSEFGYCLQ